MEFVKMHGLGNDFVLFPPETEEIAEGKLPQFAQRVCDRHFGVGGDGIILVLPSDRAEVKMRIFNSDGSEAEMCGNGVRCLAKFVYQRKLVSQKRFSVEAKGRIVTPEVKVEGDRVVSVTVDMGEPALAPEEVPVLISGDRAVNFPILIENKNWLVTAVSMGNPHAVIFETPVNWRELGKILENHPLFPQGTNVEFVRIISPQEVEVKVWERGAGATLACGTGACAVTVAGVINNLLTQKVTVHLPGGSLLVEWDREKNRVLMEGPAEEVFCGSIPEEVVHSWMLQPG